MSIADLFRSGNLRVLASLLGPAFRGLVQRRGREGVTSLPVSYQASLDWRYQRTDPELARLYESAKSAQWNPSVDLQWETPVDPLDPERPLLPESLLPMAAW